MIGAVGERARKKILWRLMPYCFLLFAIAYLDRVNVGFAALQMKKGLGFDDSILGFGAGIFFIGYFILEIPCSLLVERWSARRLIARIMVSWGIVAIAMGFVKTVNQFYALRFILGAAEAGFFPGLIVYFSHWFRYQDRAKVVALFMTAIPISNILGAPLSGALLGLHGMGLEGWRWLFIIEGIPAVIFGIVTIFFLTDRPSQARWLADDERKWIEDELREEETRKTARRRLSVVEALKNREVILLALAYFFMVTSIYGFNFWLPTIVKKLSGLSDMTVTLISALPYCFALAAMLFTGWSSDRTQERRWHTAICMMISGAGLLLGIASGDRTAAAVAALCFAATGMYGYLPGFWALPTSFLTGTAAAASIGLINSIGNLGGFAGPYVVGYISKHTGGSYVGGLLYLALSAFTASVFVLSLRATRN